MAPLGRHNLTNHQSSCNLHPAGANFLSNSFHSTDRNGISSWLSILPLDEFGFSLHKGEFQDALCLRYGWSLPYVSSSCTCGYVIIIKHLQHRLHTHKKKTILAIAIYTNDCPHLTSAALTTHLARVMSSLLIECNSVPRLWNQRKDDLHEGRKFPMLPHLNYHSSPLPKGTHTHTHTLSPTQST